MSNSTKVRNDEFSLYVRAGGHIFRPVEAKYGWPLHGTERPEDSKHKEGDVVKARHIPQSSMGKVGDEYWFSHGTYFVGDGKHWPSTLCWRPHTDKVSHEKGLLNLKSLGLRVVKLARVGE